APPRSDVPGSPAPRGGWSKDRPVLETPEVRAQQLSGSQHRHPGELTQLVRDARSGNVEALRDWVTRNGSDVGLKTLDELHKEIPEHALWGLAREKPKLQPQLVDLIGKRRGGTAPSPEEVETRQAVHAKLQEHPSVTVVVESGPGSGHQAAAVTLVRSLRELGYSGRVRIVAPESVRGRLDRLLDTEELKVEKPHYVPEDLEERRYDQPVRPDLGEGLTLVAASDNLEVSHESAEALLSYTGGSKALVLTPYAWSKPRAVYERVPGQDGQYQAWHLDGGVSKKDGLYQFDIPAPEKAAFPDDPKLQAIADSVFSGQVDVMPVYGLVRLNENLRATAPEYFASAVRESGARDVDGTRTYGRPAVVLEIGGKEVDYAPQHQEEWLKRAHLDQVEDVPELLSGLKDGDVLILRTGPTGQGDFEKLFQLGDLPAVQEGANTTNASQLTGRPYLSPATNTTPYPKVHQAAAVDMLHERVRTALGPEHADALPDLDRAREKWDEATWKKPQPSAEDFRDAARELREAADRVNGVADGHPDPAAARALREAAAKAREDASVLERSSEVLHVDAELQKATLALYEGTTPWSEAAAESEPYRQLGSVKWGQAQVRSWSELVSAKPGTEAVRLPVDRLEEFAKALVHNEDRTREPSAEEREAAREKAFAILSEGLDEQRAAELRSFMHPSSWETKEVLPEVDLGPAAEVRGRFEALGREIDKAAAFYTQEVKSQLGGLSNAPRPEHVATIAQVIRGFRTEGSEYQAYTSEITARGRDWRQDQVLMSLRYMDDPYVRSSTSVESSANEALDRRKQQVEAEQRRARQAEEAKAREEARARREAQQRAELEARQQERERAAQRAAAEAAAREQQEAEDSDSESGSEMEGDFGALF
uniref:hypothetical protein n=1 Tax=Peterkaempfera griseoplana TaxID=66896 RepID=UPI000A61DC60